MDKEDRSTDVREFLEDLDGGVFEQKLAASLSSVAQGVAHHEKVGEVTVKLKLKPISGNQIAVEHSLVTKRPTRRGDASETDATKTPMHVGRGGKLTLFPDTQEQMFGRDGQAPAPEHQPLRGEE